MITTIEFDAFGVRYRTQQFPAVEALMLMEFRVAQTIHPTYLLRHTWALDPSGEWVCLSSPQAIDTYVKDVLDIMAPCLVLRGIMGLVDGYTFGFLIDWKGVKIPQRFIVNSKTVETVHLDGLLAQLINAHVATLKELEEYYSLEDAYKMFDAIMAKSVNDALANEAALKEAKSSHHA